MDMDPRFTPRKGIPWLENPRPKPNFVDDRCAPQCDDQLPIFSRVGRGPKGDSIHAKIEVIDGHTHLLIYENDELIEDQIIDGGVLTYTINRVAGTSTPCFTITFVYDSPVDTQDWSFTTPPIPYDGNFSGTVIPAITTVFTKNLDTNVIHDVTVYPAGWSDDDKADFGDPWTATITYGAEAEYSGVAPDIQIPTVAGVLDHLHADLGWGDHTFAGDGGSDTVESLVRGDIGWADQTLVSDGGTATIESLVNAAVAAELAPIIQTLGDILNKIYLGGTRDADTGVVTWPNTNKIPIGDLNIFAGTETPLNSTVADSIRSRALSNNDLKAI